MRLSEIVVRDDNDEEVKAPAAEPSMEDKVKELAATGHSKEKARKALEFSKGDVTKAYNKLLLVSFGGAR